MPGALRTVPFIGLNWHTVPGGREKERKRSGDDERNVDGWSRKYAEWGAGLRSRKRLYCSHEFEVELEGISEIDIRVRAVKHNS